MKKNKKRYRGKINKKRLLIFFLFLFVIIFALYIVIKLPIKNIYIKNNEIYKDQEIIELARINKYPSYYLTTKLYMKKNLLKESLIKNVHISKNWKRKIIIEVEEYKVLYIDKHSNKYILENKDQIVTDKINYNVPVLINSIPLELYDKFINVLISINDSILLKISEIEYKPNDIDKERFLLSLNDGNYVYLTLETFNKINNYESIIKSIGHNTGIFYLDYGDYFEPSKNIKNN